MRQPAAQAVVKGDLMTTTLLQQLPDLLSATRALAENLLASEPFALYRQAQAQLDADSQARDLLHQLSQAQTDLRRKQVQGGVTQADVTQLRVMQAAAQSNRVIVEYASTQQGAITYLREVNQAISELIGTDFAALAKKSTC
jgi:cell fate (sporulation/competence/biofilm development) regulator YlbF (YheA/YmcA/DUF963 family)